jgi:diguanylate cyclase
VILPGADLQGGIALGERILSIMRSEPVVLDDGGRCTATVSIGIAAESLQPERLLKMADDALYQAKEQGRDRWCTSEN